MTIIDICNNALADICHDRTITSLTDGTAEAANCARFYPRARRGVFASHAWSFLTTTEPAYAITLPTALVDPSHPFSYARPADILSMTVYDADGVAQEFIADAQNLRTVSSAATIAITRDNEDPDTWPPLVQEAVIAALALKLANPITANGRIMQMAAQNAATLLLRAKAADARISTARPGTPNRYANARQG